MAKYISLIQWTDKGIKEIKESPSRADKAKALAKSLGGELQQMFMTLGQYDMVAVLEMPNDEAMARFALGSAGSGHIRTTTLKAFDEMSYRKLVASA